ncbi:hypothetical protein V1512DRAFT_252382 [Lipomyces arxii]|uniref:uncharacterized protein n=1 Tax=Lipomyces arxii TaxID=56418 RepID=UPI0034CD0B95
MTFSGGVGFIGVAAFVLVLCLIFAVYRRKLLFKNARPIAPLQFNPTTRPTRPVRTRVVSQTGDDTGMVVLHLPYRTTAVSTANNSNGVLPVYEPAENLPTYDDAVRQQISRSSQGTEGVDTEECLVFVRRPERAAQRDGIP